MKKSYCTNPLSVAQKVDLKSGKIKRRPCLDLSRHVNFHLLKSPTKLADLDTSAILLDRGDWQAALDLQNQYFHVRLHPSNQQFFGFKLSADSGSIEYYVFAVMVYGVSVATSVVTRLIKPIVVYLHKQGLKFSIFIDDGRTVAASYELAQQHHQLAIETFEKAGWNIQHEKTSVIPTQTLYYQGFINDTKNMIYYLPKFKKDHLKAEIESLLGKFEMNSVQTRTLAKVVGKVVSSLRALGPAVRLLIRSSQQAIDSEVCKSGWDTVVTANVRMKEDLTELLSIIDEENGQPILTSKTGIPLNDLVPGCELTSSSLQG